ncbi:nuclear transport factor 2 family protein [Kribbella deserti]|uniref:Nuclear transport factor 2 family protein n=1 Tax=Kribbella deserti TaxID=1926257 RepID=A0ABV6QTA6_9ACTN
METFEALLRRWIQAESAGDVRALRKLLADDFRGDGPNGYVLDKPQWLDRHASGDLAIRYLDWKVVDLHADHHLAVAAGLQTQAAWYRGQSHSGVIPSALVAIRRYELWSLVNLQYARQRTPANLA